MSEPVKLPRGRVEKALTRVVRTSVSSAVFEQILSYVVRGDWTEGQRIPAERDLSKQLGIARPSLREALKALEIIGLLESRVGDGTYVRPRSEFLSRPLLWAIAGSSSTNVQEIVESRLVLEVELAGFAATRALKADIAEIRAGIEDLKAAGSDGGLLLQADVRFHLAIATSAHNHVLLNAVQMIRNLMQKWMLVTLGVPGIIPRVIDQHISILSAIESGDAVRARQRMREHIDEMGNLLIRVRGRRKLT